MDTFRKRILSSILIVVMIISASGYLLSGSSVKDLPVFEESSALDPIDKLRKAEKLGGTVELSEAEANAALKLYTKKILQSQEYLQAINIKLGEKDTVEFFAPASFKNKFSFMIYSQGKLSLSEEKIVYQPKQIKVGKFPLPISWVINKIQTISEKYSQGITIAEEKVVISNLMIPFHLSSLSVDKGIMTLGIKKAEVPKPSKQTSGTGDPYREKETDQKINDPATSTEEDLSSEQSAKGETNPAMNGNLPEGQNNKPEEVEAPNQASDDKKRELLQQVHSQLGIVYSNLRTSEQKKIIGTMLSTVSELSKDLNYHYQGKAAWVIGEYKKLTPEEKKELKQVMLTYMDIETAIEVKNLFGL